MQFSPEEIQLKDGRTAVLRLPEPEAGMQSAERCVYHVQDRPLLIRQERPG